MSWPAALRSSYGRVTAVFVAAELVLAMSIPFLAIAGYHSLLDSHAGQFVAQPTAGQPGWRAVVEPTPVIAVVELTAQQVTGLVLIVGHPVPDRSDQAPTAANMVLVPSTLVLDGQPIGARTAEAAVSALSTALRLGIGTINVLDHDRWARVLGGASYLLENPDPVAGPDDRPTLAVGPVEVDADNVVTFLGRPAVGADPTTLLFRRRLLWTALLARPPMGDDPFAVWLAAVAGADSRVIELPWRDGAAGPEIDPVATEALVRELVPVPAGAQPGDRTQVRVIDRTGTADLSAVAAEVAATGLEVVEIGNAAEFDAGATSLVVPRGLDDPGLIELAAWTGAATVVDGEPDADPVVTLLIGSDFAPPTARGVPAERRSAEQRRGAAAMGPAGGRGRR